MFSHFVSPSAHYCPAKWLHIHSQCLNQQYHACERLKTGNVEGRTVLHRMAAAFGAHVDDAEAARQGEVELIGVVVLWVLGQNAGEDPVYGEGIVARAARKSA